MKRVLLCACVVGGILTAAFILTLAVPGVASVRQPPSPLGVAWSPPFVSYRPKVATSADATGGVAVWTTETRERFQIGSIFISAETAMTVTLRDGGTDWIPIYVADRGGACVTLGPGWQSKDQGNDLSFITDVPGNVTVVVSGEPVWY